MNNLTIIYYTANLEDPAFEKKVMLDLLIVAGGNPIISVSHKSMEFGRNICVGKQVPCDHNIFRQLLIGCEEAKTDFVACAESDCFYPVEHFEYRPDEGTVARNTNLYIGKSWVKGFWKKNFSLCTQIGDRQVMIRELKKSLKKKPTYWGGEKKRGYDMFKNGFIPFKTNIPVLNYKTGNGLRTFSNTDEPGVEYLEGIGDSELIRRKLFEA